MAYFDRVYPPKPLTPDAGLGHVFKFNKNHDSKGRFAKVNAGPAATSATSGRTLAEHFDKYNDPSITQEKILARFSESDRADIARHLEAVNKLPPTTNLYSVNGDGTGGYTKERQAVHAKIIADILNDAAVAAATPRPGEKPSFVVLGGRGGSGKSAFTNGKIKEFDAKKHILLDSDAIKAALRPPYEGWNAASVHEESAQIFNAISQYAFDKGLNIVHDATLKSGGKYEVIAKDAIAKGYDVQGHYMFVPPQEAAVRAVKRYLGHPPDYKRGRLVPVSAVLGMTKNERNFDALKPYFSKWSAYDNQGSAPVLIERKKD